MDLIFGSSSLNESKHEKTFACVLISEFFSFKYIKIVIIFLNRKVGRAIVERMDCGNVMNQPKVEQFNTEEEITADKVEIGTNCWTLWPQ